jgi:uncharacterized repeat protein (TIGR04138 family)
MHEADFREAARRIAGRDPRYHAEAYSFIREALDYASKALNKPTEGVGRHVTGQELLACVREFALREFGPMAATVLREWGVKKTEDFGDLVFNLVDSGILGKTDEDRKEDFANGYDFFEAFEKPFLPPSARDGRKRRARGPHPA